MKKLFKKESKRGWTTNEKQMYIMACAGVAFLLVFCYLAMYGGFLAF